MPAEIEILPEIQHLLPPLSDDERAALDAGLLEAGGSTDLLVVWAREGSGHVLLDGHNRRERCAALNLPEPGYRVLHFTDVDQAKNWVIRHQLGRRNLTDRYRRHFLGVMYDAAAQQQGGDVRRRSNTAETIADEHGVSAATVYRARQVAVALELATVNHPDVRRAILCERLRMTDSEIVDWAALEDGAMVAIADDMRRRLEAGSTEAPRVPPRRPARTQRSGRAASAPGQPPPRDTGSLRASLPVPAVPIDDDPTTQTEALIEAAQLRFELAANAIQELRRRLELAMAEPGGDCLALSREEMMRELATIEARLAPSAPAGVCPECEAELTPGVRCRACGGRRWLSRQQLDSGEDAAAAEPEPDAPQPATAAGTRFVKPTLEEVSAYCRERQNGVNPQQWIDHYESNGWRVGRTPMRDWRAAVRTWERNNLSGGSPNEQRDMRFRGDGEPISGRGH